MNKKFLICINCPMGCHLTVEHEGDNILSVSGNKCKRGKDYAIQEFTCPLRVLTGNMKAKNFPVPFSVRTNKPIPKSLLLECALELKKHHPKLPVHSGDVIIKNILNTGVDIIATQELERK